MKPLDFVINSSANPHVAIIHYPEILASNYINLIAIADDNETRLKAAEDFFGSKRKLKFYSDYREMYQKHPEAEAVMIGSDNCHHLQHTLEAIGMGKHVLSMKNLSMNENECREMIASAERAGVILQVELILHFEPRFRNLLKRVREGQLGKILAFYITNISHCPINYYPNWGKPELVYGKRMSIRPGANVYRGGALTDHPHPFDLARKFSGSEFKSIYAMNAPNIRNHIEVEDHAAINAEMRNGIKVFINPSYSNLEEKSHVRGFIWPKSLDCLLKIYGEKGMLISDFREKPNLMVSARGLAAGRLFADGRRQCANFGDSLLSSFFLSCRGRRPVESNGFDGLQATCAINAAYDSIYNNKTIDLEDSWSC